MIPGLLSFLSGFLKWLSDLRYSHGKSPVVKGGKKNAYKRRIVSFFFCPVLVTTFSELSRTGHFLSQLERSQG